MKLLLDTCTFLWIAGESRRVAPHVLEAYQSPDNEVYLSAASAWEIAVKYAGHRLDLPSPPAEFVATERARRSITTLPVDEESALHVAKLPSLHRDPFDRMLVSQSIVHGLVIVTPDSLIAQYPIRTMW